MEMHVLEMFGHPNRSALGFAELSTIHCTAKSPGVASGRETSTAPSAAPAWSIASLPGSCTKCSQGLRSRSSCGCNGSPSCTPLQDPVLHPAMGAHPAHRSGCLSCTLQQEPILHPAAGGCPRASSCEQLPACPCQHRDLPPVARDLAWPRCCKASEHRHGGAAGAARSTSRSTPFPAVARSRTSPCRSPPWAGCLQPPAAPEPPHRARGSSATDCIEKTPNPPACALIPTLSSFLECSYFIPGKGSEKVSPCHPPWATGEAGCSESSCCSLQSCASIPASLTTPATES